MMTSSVSMHEADLSNVETEDESPMVHVSLPNMEINIWAEKTNFRRDKAFRYLTRYM